MSARIPITNRAGQTVAHAIVDDEWAWLLVYRWSLLPNGYAVRTVSTPRGARKVFLHRQLMGLDRRHRRTQVDHVNGDRLDCCKVNLRVGTAALNQQNRGPSWNGSLPRGVVLDKRRGCYYARCTIKGRTYNLGTFLTAQAASEAASNFRAVHMPWSPDARQAA